MNPIIRPLKTIASIALLFAAACSQPNSSAQPESPAGQPLKILSALETARGTTGRGEPLIWLVSDEDTKIFILGTMSMVDPKVPWINDGIAETLFASDLFINEISYETDEHKALVADIFTHKMRLEAGTNPYSQLTERQMAEIDRYSAKFGFLTSELLLNKPIAVQLQLTETELLRNGYAYEANMGEVLEFFAYSRNIPTASLSDPSEIVTRMSDLPLKGQLQMLTTSLEALPYYVELIDAFMSEWLEGDLSGMEALCLNDGPICHRGNEDFSEFVVLWNKNAGSEITSLLDHPGQYFIAVGMGHMLGDNNLLSFIEGESVSIRVGTPSDFHSNK